MNRGCGSVVGRQIDDPPLTSLGEMIDRTATDEIRRREKREELLRSALETRKDGALLGASGVGDSQKVPDATSVNRSRRKPSGENSPLSRPSSRATPTN